MVEYVYLITLFPLIGFLVNGIFGYKIRNEKVSGIIGSGTIFISFVISIILFFNLLEIEPAQRSISVTVFSWINSGIFKINAAYLVDPLSVVMSLIVTGVGFLIHVYSMGYMHGDRGYARFFAFMNLFIFAMLNLVLADNFLLMFLGWEGVGLCSYLLIGFWYEKKFTGDAANKAFWVNRIGDFGFMIAMFFIFSNFFTLNFNDVFGAASGIADVKPWLIPVITILLFVGATGKSAQIPLYIWLPDAMAGPTPVSALIHAATMVTAGVYMVARCSILFALSPFTMDLVLAIGAFTAFIAATIAITQNDIKKILAYSTISQLGFMFMAMGVGAFSTGIFHVTTHAFFKALMFLGAGSVIHGLHEEQDITRMGGLRTKMKVTFLTFLMGGVAISGIPPFSGFFSKDEILTNVFMSGKYFYFVLGLLTAFMTAFYIFRLICLTFYSNPRYDSAHVHPHEAPKVMTVPLIILAVLSVIGGFIGLPHIIGTNLIGNFLDPVFANSNKFLVEHHIVASTEIILIAVSVLAAVISIYLSFKIYTREYRISKFMSTAFYRIVQNKYYVDEFYNAVIVVPIRKISEVFYAFIDLKVIDGVIDGTAKFFTGLSADWRKLQTGVIQDYAIFSIAGIVAILAYILLK